MLVHKMLMYNETNEMVYTCKYNITDLKINKLLGKGTYGKVYLAEDKITKKSFALKILDKRINHKWDIAAELIAYTSFMNNCPFIVTIHSVFQTANYAFLVLEYLTGGRLFKYIPMSKNQVAFYAAEISLALFFMHSREIIYRDLKLENVMLAADGHVKLFDFGVSAFQLEEKGNVGTREYFPPEMIRDKHHLYSMDWWSLGIFIYYLFNGYFPFDFPTPEETLRAIEMNPVPYPESMSKDCLAICKALLKKNPRKRLGGAGGKAAEKDVKNHKFFKNINWEKLCVKQIKPPIIPPVSELPVDDCTEMEVEDYFAEENTEVTDEDQRIHGARISMMVRMTPKLINGRRWTKMPT